MCKRLCSIFFAAIILLVYTSVTAADAQPHLLINQVYGGFAANNGASVSHSFIELYNPSENAVQLDGWSVQYAPEGTDWQLLELTGELLAKHSFLIRGNESNSDARVKIEQYDMQWDIFLNNKGVKVVLMENTQPLDMVNPFAARPDGYVDMIGVAGNSDELTVDGCETDFLKVQSKQKSVRRINYRDTDNNARDLEVIDFSSADIEKYRPRCLSDGPIEAEPEDEDFSLTEDEEDLVYFKDVAINTPVFMGISLLSELGILHNEIMFNPANPVAKSDFLNWVDSAKGVPSQLEHDNSTVILSDALNIVLRELGYGPILDNVNTPMQIIARDEGLLKNISIPLEQTLTRGDALLLVTNAMQVYHVSEISVGSEIEYAQIFRNWLTEIHGVEMVEGIIIDRPYFTTSSNHTLLKMVSKFGETITCKFNPATRVDELLGYNIVAYVKEAYHDGLATMITAVKTERNKELIIKKSAYGRVASANDRTIIFEHVIDGKSLPVQIALDAKFVYNGALSNKIRQAAIELVDFKPSHTGNITLLDYNNDNIYDYVFIINYKDIVVSGVDKVNFVVTNKLIYNASTSDKLDKFNEIERVTLDPTSTRYKTAFMTSDGMPASFSDIKMNYTLSVGLSSLDDETVDSAVVRNVYISKDIKKGIVTESYIDSGDYNFVVDAKAYETSKSYNKTFEKGDSDRASYFNVGDFVELHLNYDKKICYAVVNRQGLDFAVLINVGAPQGLDGDRKVALFDQKHGYRVYTLTDKEFKRFGIEHLSLPSVLKATIVDDKIANIKTSTDGKSVKSEYNGTFRYRRNVGRFGGLFVTDDTRIFVYQGSRGDANVKQGEFYQAIDKSMLTNMKEFDADIYNIENKFNPGLIFLYTNGEVFYRSDVIMGVEKVTEATDDAGNNAKYIYCMSEGELQKYKLSDEFTGTIPTPKSIIRVSVNTLNEIYNIFPLYRGEDVDFEHGNVFDDDYCAFRKNVTGIDGNILTIESNGRVENYMSNKDTRVYIIDSINNENISPYAFDNILPGSKVLLYQKDGILSDIYVIEGDAK